MDENPRATTREEAHGLVGKYCEFAQVQPWEDSGAYATMEGVFTGIKEDSAGIWVCVEYGYAMRLGTCVIRETEPYLPGNGFRKRGQVSA